MMDTENTIIEYKSLKKITSGEAGFKDLAVTCVCLANTQGGNIVIGIEDKEKEPPLNQTISHEIIAVLNNFDSGKNLNLG